MRSGVCFVTSSRVAALNATANASPCPCPRYPLRTPPRVKRLLFFCLDAEISAFQNAHQPLIADGCIYLLLPAAADAGTRCPAPPEDTSYPRKTSSTARRYSSAVRSVRDARHGRSSPARWPRRTMAGTPPCWPQTILVPAHGDRPLRIAKLNRRSPSDPRTARIVPRPPAPPLPASKPLPVIIRFSSSSEILSGRTGRSRRCGPCRRDRRAGREYPPDPLLPRRVE